MRTKCLHNEQWIFFENNELIKIDAEGESLANGIMPAVYIKHRDKALHIFIRKSPGLNILITEFWAILITVSKDKIVPLEGEKILFEFKGEEK
jgi:hypothetical protein